MCFRVVGRLNVTFAMPHIGELELSHTELSAGGVWWPPDCRPRHRVAIIVPFRDRETHLRIFLNQIHPMLQRQMLHYRIFVVEQVCSLRWSVCRSQRRSLTARSYILYNDNMANSNA